MYYYYMSIHKDTLIYVYVVFYVYTWYLYAYVYGMFLAAMCPLMQVR